MCSPLKKYSAGNGVAVARSRRVGLSHTHARDEDLSERWTASKNDSSVMVSALPIVGHFYMQVLQINLHTLTRRAPN